MAKKKAEQVGQGVGLVVGLAMVAALLAAAVLPLFLFFRYLQHRYLAYRLRKDYDMARNEWWLSEEERQYLKESYAEEKARLAKNLDELSTLDNLIAREGQKAAERGISINNDGSYHRGSEEGKRIEELEVCKQELDLNEYEISCRQPLEFWNELNDLLKKQDVAFVALLGWACGAFFFYSAYQQGAPFGIWLDLFIPALCAGVGAGLAALFSQNPAVRYMPKPVAITIENVDSPAMELPQKGRFFLKFTGICVWIGAMVLASQEGHQYGEARARQCVAEKKELKTKDVVSDDEPFYSWKVAGDLVGQSVRDKAAPVNNATTLVPTESVFSGNSKMTPRMLKNLNSGEVEEGHAPLPVEESPSVGRVVSPDLEEANVVTPAPVLKAIPVSEAPAVIQGNLDAEVVGRWSLPRVRYEINTIYARHGMVFPKREIQTYFESQDWYQPVPGRTFDEVEQSLSPAEKIDIEILAARREALGKVR